MELIDTHCHLNDKRYADDLQVTIERAQAKGVDKMIVIGVDQVTGEQALTLAEKYDNIFAACAWHPVDVIDCTEEDKRWLERAWEHPKVVAIGETGLDYHWDKSPRDLQATYFRWHLEQAIQHKLPFIVHDRDAHVDTLNILRDFYNKYGPLKGVMHSYAGGASMLEEFLKLGLHISVSGVVTFKNAQNIKETVPLIPANRLLVETDAPYLTPVPFRGQRNEPAYTYYTAEEIANLRNESLEYIAEITTKNAVNLFNLS